MMATTGKRIEKVMTRHPEGKQGVNIARDKYDEMKRAILKVLGRSRTGMPFTQMSKEVAEHLPSAVYPPTASVAWYCVSVKLDLEARGIIERVPRTSPQCLRRVLQRKKEG